MARSGGKGFLIGALIGTVVGGVTALLLAPKSGEKLRKDVARKYNDYSDQTSKLVNSLGDHASDLACKAKEMAEEAKDVASDFLKEINKRK